MRLPTMAMACARGALFWAMIWPEITPRAAWGLG
jgi:hypothetical protein